MFKYLAKLALLTGLFGNLLAAEPVVETEQLPRVPPTPPEKALETFQIKDGFRLELAAAEPLVVDPIAICFDENSRMFVVEMRDYSERRDERLGRIRMLEDTDGDGRMDQSTIFAEGLPWPTALFWYDGGLFVVSTPDVYYFRDRDGDGKAEEKQVVFAGFGAQAARLNVQALPNNLHWTLDNRIHGATSFNGGVVVCPIHPERGKVTLRGQDFSFDPRTLELRAESGGGQHGLTFDNYGRKFICSNSSHIRQVMYEARYLRQGIAHLLPPAALDIPVDGGAAEVFRISPDEPWRVIRTKWRVAGLVSGPVEGGGRSSGYFTSASGLVIYRGDALGDEFGGDEFVADVGSNLVHRKKVRPNGVAFLAERPADEQKKEFLASSDNWFRPVQLANGPDGALYILDMYRETIEHPWSLPPNLKKHLDLNSGNDRGRIYRVVPENSQRKPWPKLGSLSGTELVKLLEHPNGWHRATAARLIYERREKELVPALRDLAGSSASSLGRLHALGTLAGLDALETDDLIRAMGDSDAGVRENAVRWSEHFFGEPGLNVSLWKALHARASDESVRVRHQLAWTLSLARNAEKWEMLARLLQSGSDEWLKHAVLASASEAPVRVWTKLDEEDRFGRSGRELLELAGRRRDSGELQQLAEELKAGTQEQLVLAYSALTSGAKAAGAKLEPGQLPQGEKALEGARKILTQPESPAGLKKGAVSLLAAEGRSSREILVQQLDAPVSGEIQNAVIGALSEVAGNDLTELLVEKWEGLAPAVRRTAIEMLLRKSGTTKELLEAVADGKIAATEIPLHQVASLRTSKDREIKLLAERIFGAKSNSTLAETLAKYREAVSRKGDEARGKAIYTERCASCHRFQGEGFAAGPDFETIQQAGRESALANIIDPNREVAPQYISFEIETKDGETHAGIIAQETLAAVTLRQANGFGAEIPRNQIARMHSSGKSLMPEGLEQGLTPAEMADLLAYILP